MNVVQTGESSALSRQKQQLRDTASKDEARAQELRRDGVDDLFTSVDRVEDAARSHQQADGLSKEAERLRRNGREQSQRGLERLADGSDRISQGSAGTEKGLQELQGSIIDLQGASEQKSQGLDTAKQGLGQQAVENGVQGANLAKFSKVNSKDAALDGVKAEQLANLEGNVEQRSQGLDRQTGQLDSYLIAGESFAEGTDVKADGFADLKSATVHTVKAEGLNDAREGQELRQTWATADQSRHESTSADLKFSSLYQSLKAKAESLNADFHKKAAERDSMTADGLAACAADLRSEAECLAQNAKVLQQSGQCHIGIGRQMQCCPWTYCQGVQLERQGCAELDEAQNLKCRAGELRAEAQSKDLQAEELRAKAEDSLARGEEFEVKAHGSTTRSGLLETRSNEHQTSAEKAGKTAESAAASAARFGAASDEQRGLASEKESSGTGKLEQGYVQQDEALEQQYASGSAFSGELSTEADLTAQAQGTAGEALKTIAKEVSFLGRGSHLLHKIGASQNREAAAQNKIQDGVDTIAAGQSTSDVAQARGVEAAKLLEQARELELEGLRLQNRGQKMLLEARPKLSLSAKLSAESFEASKKAERLEEEAASLIESGTQKISAAGVLRDKAAAYKKIAAE